jgi:fatty-acyl-CoA synthase
MDIAEWIEHQAAFVPGQRAIVGEGCTLDYAGLAAAVARAARALAASGVGPGERVAILDYNRPETLVLLFACARLRAVLVPLNWRLATPEHAAILADCTPRVLVVGAAFAPGARALLAALPGAFAVGLGCDADPAWTRWEDWLARGDAGAGCVEATDAGAGSVDATDTGADGAASPPGAARPGPAERAPAERAATAADPFDAPVLLSYTSGSTGQPKGVLLSQRALFFNAVNSTHLHGLTGADVVLTTLPLFHVGGLNILTTPALHAGATVILHPRFEPAAAFDALEREAVTLTVLVPAQLEAMMADPRWKSADLSRLRCITTGSTIIGEAFARRVQARGIPLVQVYGATETCPIAAYLPIADAMRKPGSVGKAALHCALRLADDAGRPVPDGTPGEILVRAPSVMDGYWNRPAESAAALAGGWYRTGDVAHADAEGFLYVDGRNRDVIISGGENIHPAEIENVLAESPRIAEVAVVGRQDAHWGEAVVAIVVPAPGETLAAEDVLGLLQGRIGRYKHPREVVFVERLPRTALGKVRREELRRIVQREPAPGAALEGG